LHLLASFHKKGKKAVRDAQLKQTLKKHLLRKSNSKKLVLDSKMKFYLSSQALAPVLVRP
jgi:hypothetical protein